MSCWCRSGPASAEHGENQVSPRGGKDRWRERESGRRNGPEKKLHRSRKRRGWRWENQEKTSDSFLINNCAHTVVTGKEEDGA